LRFAQGQLSQTGPVLLCESSVRFVGLAPVEVIDQMFEVPLRVL
jgi:hypothetical protein